MLALQALTLESELSAQPFWIEESFWNQQSAYVGSSTCLKCHSQIYKKQEASNHARSLRPVGEISEIFSHLPFQLFDRSSGSELGLDLGPNGQLVLTATRDGMQERLTLKWAFGAGAKGITPVGQDMSGQFVESRLSWYESLNHFDLTPGARERIPQNLKEGLGRTLTEEERIQCFGCHTSSSTVEDPIPEREEMGIRCERCHVPGLEHVKAMQQGDLSNRKIFHPGTLDGFSQAQFCGVCHGRPPEDTDLAGIRFIEETPLTVRFPSSRLVLSRCFLETANGLKCTLCHDPHTNVPEKSPLFDRTCQGCHQKRFRKNGTVCSVATDRCTSCHMPRRRVMLHSEFIDHWIRVVREEDESE